jgi:hypothetical protein
MGGNMKQKICIIAIGMLVCLLATTILATASEDNCINCEEDQVDVQPFTKLYCKVFEIKESDLYNKVTLKVETRSHTLQNLEYVVFYNVTESQLRIIDDNRCVSTNSADGHWINIYYTIDAKQHCHILMVEKAEMNSNETPTQPDQIITGIAIACIVAFFVGLFIGDAH